jgi:TPP-dependent pyruvate/acetoin dehydrogenase alpha subunit
MITIEELIKFETQIGDLFNTKQIRAPIHLYHGNEKKIIEIFKRVDITNDWVCCTWRNHYQALLKNIPPEYLKDKIVKGKSMVLTLPEYKFICSSIVGGIPSIATGIALGLQLEKTAHRVWCWVGDMSAETGAFHEAYKYARNHELPVTFIVESNGLSVMTPTEETWKRDMPYYINNAHKFYQKMEEGGIYEQPGLIYYEYKNQRYPHAGAGIRVQF